MRNIYTLTVLAWSLLSFICDGFCLCSFYWPGPVLCLSQSKNGCKVWGNKLYYQYKRKMSNLCYRKVITVFTVKANGEHKFWSSFHSNNTSKETQWFSTFGGSEILHINLHRSSSHPWYAHEMNWWKKVLAKVFLNRFTNM